MIASDADDADKLAYNFVMSALTLATESIPTALIAFSQKEIIAELGPVSPREALKKSLELTEKIQISEAKARVLQSPSNRRIKRSISQLEKLEADPAKRFAEVLEVEYQANKNIAQQHPICKSLTKIIKMVPPPATLTMVSSANMNEDDLNVTLERLNEKGYRTVQVGNK